MGRASQMRRGASSLLTTGINASDLAALSSRKQDDVDARNMRLSTGTLGKAVDLLSIIAAAPQPLRFTDILQQSDQPRGTLHRQLSNLVEEGLLSVNSDHTYSLGLRLLQLASKAWSGNEFRRISEPHIRRLQEQTGETVHLGILKDLSVVYLDKVESQQSVRMHSMIGNTSPIYCTGVGKAALSLHEDQWIEDHLSGLEFHAFTQTTLPDVNALLDEVRQIRRDGIAWDREEHETGIHCVAAPINGTSQGIYAGVSVTAPVYRVSKAQLQRFADLVKATANGISEEIHARLSPRS